MLHKLTPNLMVENVAQTIESYRDLLGFQVDQTVPESPPYDWASVRSGDVELMFQSRPSLSSDVPVFQGAPTGGTLTFFIELEGINDLYSRIKDRVKIHQELHDTFYGMREFAFIDLNSYILVFASPVK